LVEVVDAICWQKNPMCPSRKESNILVEEKQG
jgi:hypothetical protein